MIAAPRAPAESDRLAELRALEILDTPPEERFDRIVRLAAAIFNAPIAYLAMIDSHRQWFKAKCVLKVDATGRDESFCGHTILNSEPMIVPDARLDERFWDNPLVVGEPYIRFYAGHPLAGPGGHNVGTLCIADRRPRSLDAGQLAIFRQLAALAEHELHLVDVIHLQRALLATQQQLGNELAEASQYVRSLLPARLDGPLRTDWQFITSSQLGGDFFGYHWLDDDRLVLYLLDVSGHGVGAALLSVSVHMALWRETLPDTRFDEPGEVLAALNRAFPTDEKMGKYFTIWYGVYQRSTGLLRYATAGHPPAVLLQAGQEPIKLGDSSLMIGVMPDASYRTHEQRVAPGSRLYLFSDGVFEIHQAENRMLMVDGLINVLRQLPSDGGSRARQVLRRIQEIQGSTQFADDFSFLELEVPATGGQEKVE